MPVVAPLSGDTRGASDSADLSLVPISPELRQPAVFPLRHGLKPPIVRLALSWARGNALRVSVLRPPSEQDSDDGEAGGKVVELRLSNGEAEISDSLWRRIAYGSLSPFALLQSRRSSLSSLSKMSMSPSPYHIEWWEYVMEYSKDISSLLSKPQSVPSSVIEDPKTILKTVEEPTLLKAAWELMEIFYADKHSQPWLPERLVDWLTDYDCLLSTTQTTIHSKLVGFQKELVNLQVIEDDPKYWEAISSALAVGWLEVVVKMLRLHGSYQIDQLGNRETENGLVEAVAVLISKMPRMRPEIEEGKGECYRVKPDFIKAWEKWRAQITKLDCSSFWVQCDHHQTREGLKNMLQIMLGNSDSLCATTCNWTELFISHLLYIRPFTLGLENMHNLAQKCMQLKPTASALRLTHLLIGILGENNEVVLAECSRSFGSWMLAHAIELLTAGSDQAENLLHEEQYSLGGISMAELHRLVYAQVLSSHVLTWQIAPIYLTSCMKQGMGLLEILLYKQPIQHNEMLLKTIEICRLYELDHISSNIMKIAGMHHWKHGRKGSGVFWLQQARDEFRLNKIAQHLFDSVGKSISDESFKQWEGLIELLGSESKIAGGLEFLHKYRDFKKSLKQVHSGKSSDAARQAVESLILLMKNPSTPQRFWLPLLYDSVSSFTKSFCS
ncbi:nuclear pore complex protein NUP85 isoform X2 [Ziziphus jujuba]|uniref:Nuclear pore complex protein Nup85 n=1 Tax=Ziziphus jujuba TaxID=326968 RepID=A0ABM3ILI9_ZIZJJ|nr:nuclear pore complex protein NUP85 isoform X2 [Ziziphus jujuba]